jgi:hypothetical protein
MKGAAKLLQFCLAERVRSTTMMSIRILGLVQCRKQVISIGSAAGRAAAARNVTFPHLSPHELGTELAFDCKDLGENGCRELARALSLNTCVADLSLCGGGYADAVFLCGALSHLTTMTHLSLSYCDLQPAGTAHLCGAIQYLAAMIRLSLNGIHLQTSGASYLCSVLPHLTAITALELADNELIVEDGVCICAAAAAAGMTQLEELGLWGNGFEAFDVVDCGTWGQLGLPQPADEIVSKIDYNLAPLSCLILMFGRGDWRQRTLQHLAAWCASAVLPFVSKKQ